MALFFDQEWFDAELARLHMRRMDFGLMLGLDETQTAELWKDQREMKAADVAIVAALLGRPPEEIASRAGISTPVPAAEGVAARLDRIEAKLDELLRRLGG